MSTHNLVWIEITPEVSESPKRVFLKTPGRNRWIIHIQRLTFNDSNVIVKSILVKNNLFFFVLAFIWLVFLPSRPFHSSSSPLSVFPIYTKF